MFSAQAERAEAKRRARGEAEKNSQEGRTTYAVGWVFGTISATGSFVRLSLCALSSGLENVQVMTDDHLSAIELTDLLQQHLLRIGSAHAAGVRTVIENQQTGARLLGDLRHLT